MSVSVINISTRWPQHSKYHSSYSKRPWTPYLPHFTMHWRISSIMPRIYSLSSLVACASNNRGSKLTVVCVRAQPFHYTPTRSENSTKSLVKIVKFLGEGGFSFVYLAQDEASGVSASLCDYDRVITTDANRVGSERVCPEENSVPNWRRGCRSSHARSRGIPEIQVRPHPHSHHLPAEHPFLRHPNTIQLYVSNMHLSSPQGLMLTLCRIRQYCKILAARAKSSTSSSPSTRPAFPRLVQFCHVFLTCNAARKLTRRNKHIYPNRRTFFGATAFAPLQGHLRSRACHASLSL